MRPEQRKKRTKVSSPCFFPADSRSPPECAPHSKAIKTFMRFRLRLFFRPSELRAFVLVNILNIVIQVVVWWGDSPEDAISGNGVPLNPGRLPVP